VPGATRAAESVEIRKELTGKSYMLARNQSAASQVKSNNMPRIAKKNTKQTARISSLGHGGQIPGLVTQQLPLPNNGGLMQLLVMRSVLIWHF